MPAAMFDHIRSNDPASSIYKCYAGSWTVPGAYLRANDNHSAMMVTAMMTMIRPRNDYLSHEGLQDRHAGPGKKYQCN